MTHAELIKRAFVWLKNTKGCSIVVSDLIAGGSEHPDVIGWHGWASILIEAKASVSDFRADFNKSFRRYQDNGMGRQRFYVIPRELKDEIMPILPENWGLLLCGKSGISVARDSGVFERNVHGEMLCLTSIIRRIAGSGLPMAGIGVRHYVEQPGIADHPRAELFIDPSLEGQNGDAHATLHRASPRTATEATL